MNPLRQVLLGIAAALLSSIVVVGSLATAIIQSGDSIALAPSSTPTPLPTLPPGAPTYTPSPIPPTATMPPTSEICDYPDGWQRIVTAPGQSLYDLAEQYHVPVETLAESNCLAVSFPLDPGWLIFVPPLPATATPTETPTWTPTQVLPTSPAATAITCSPRIDWSIYVIRRGDTLFSLATAYGLTVAQLMQANCLTSDRLITGQILRVPYLPVPGRVATATPIPPRPTPVNTPVPPTPTSPPPTSTRLPATATNTVPPPSATPLPPTATEPPPPATETLTPTTQPTATLTPTVVPPQPTTTGTVPPVVTETVMTPPEIIATTGLPVETSVPISESRESYEITLLR